MHNAIALILMIPSILLEGLTFSLLWAWFVSPLGAPPIAIAQAIGLCLLARIGIGWVGLKNEEFASPLSAVLTCIVHFGLVMGFGWIVHCFM